MTPTEMFARYRRLIGSPNRNDLSDKQCSSDITSALFWLASELKYSVRMEEQGIGLVAGQVEYDLPTDFGWMLWVEWNGLMLTPASLFQWNRDQATWRTTTAANPGDFAIEARKLILMPAASAAAIVTDPFLAFRYVSAPELTDTATPGLSDLDQHLAVYKAAQEYVAARPSDENNIRYERYTNEVALRLSGARKRAANAIREFWPGIHPHTSRMGSARLWVRISLPIHLHFPQRPEPTDAR